MLNEEKIKLMTSIAMFEKKEGKKIFPINHCFKSDYVSGRMLRSFFGYTLCYILGALVWCLYSINRLLDMANTEEIIKTASWMVIYYVAGLAVYQLITMIVYMRRYNYANRMMKVYLAKLRRLDKRYEYQGKTKEFAKEGRTYDGSSRI